MNRKLIVKVKKVHKDAVIPKYATVGAGAFDLVAVEDVFILPGEIAKIPLGLAFEIPEGFGLFVIMRSGTGFKTRLRQSNKIGLIDSDYRGEVSMLFDNVNDPTPLPRWGDSTYQTMLTIEGKRVASDAGFDRNTYIIRKGDRVAQGYIIPLPQVEFEESDELSETERGDGGFGHTGVNS